MSSYNHFGCSYCGGPFNGGNCPSCSSVGSGNEFVYDPNPYSYNETPNFFNQPPQYQYETYSCEFCGGNSHPGYDCQTGNTPVYDQGPCYNQDFGFNQPLHYFPSQPQQFPCENCGVLHENDQCQPMNQNYDPNFCYDPIYSGFDQYQPPQFPEIHYPPQATVTELLQARENLMETIQAFLKEYDHIPPDEKCMALLLAEERFLKIKQAVEEEQNQPEVMQELLLKLMNDLQILKGIQPKQEELAVQSFAPYGNFSMIDDVEVLMKDIYTFLRKFSRIPFGVTPKVLLIAWERFGEIKHAFTDEHYQQEDIQELISKLLEDVRNINEELSEYINCPNWNRPTFYDDDDEYTIIYRKTKAITPDLPIEEPNNSLSMGDEHLNTISETEKSSVENFVPIPSEFKGISEHICDVSSCDYFDAECGLINSLLSRDISITSPKSDFLPEEFVGELDFIDPILPGTDEDNFDEDEFDEEEGENDNDILQIEDEILPEKLLNVNLLVHKIEALKLTPSIPFVLENPSFSLIPIVDSDFLVEEVDTFLVSKDSIPPGIESDFDSEEDIIFLDNLLNDDPIPKYERFTFDIEPDAPVINNFDKLNEDECFNPGGGEIVVSQNVEDDDSFAFVIRIFLQYRTYPVDSSLLLSTGSEDTIFDPGIST
ncbi:hypothetical protein Tco_1132055 [Tanacetum coccineum]|uniref:Uncharacterized protein n=1 Tax=Tanacetum coccineum TaxID=301880 RepID=A0ABQ5JEY5_9ASTR